MELFSILIMQVELVFLLRNSAGQVLNLCGKQVAVESPFQSESKALLEGLKSVEGKELGNILVESDWLLLVNAVEKGLNSFVIIFS